MSVHSPLPSPLVLPLPAALDTRSFFKLHWTCFKVLGIIAPTSNAYYFGYSVLLHLLVTFCYPLHLAMALFSNTNASANIQNLAVCVTCVACSMKFIIYATKMERLRELEAIMAALDERVNSSRERRYLAQLRKEIRHIIVGFLSIYTLVGVTAELRFIFRNEHNLLYPAWFPFDWRASDLKFYAAHLYQIVGISFQLLQNFVNDCFPTMTLVLLSAHIKLLGIRVSQIGYANRSLDENEEELFRCIKDQEQLYNMLNVIQNIISLPMFLQFTVTAFNICLAMAALFFFVDAPFDRLYYFTYFLSMPLQIFPTCYYGTDFQLLFEKLHIEMYSSNWVEQTQKFRKHMILFCERSLKQHTAMAGGIVRIHLDTFVSTCKGAYSLLAVIMKMNE
ncbi:PREDICTED: odorant receptor 59a-like [Rhagoletis zephyria]|uniref:odorant receptor 59a-like n=1 Tax=Rhagoletis zephyria TaxID=28612 RepID=UPI0008113344|nr:PREDICTED: odorant receptor 59a-like [Rhagoletis zephyria]